MKPRTSQDSPIELYEVVPLHCGGGSVAITLAPGKKTAGTYTLWQRDLEIDLGRIRELGITTLVPLLTDDELAELQIPNLVEAARGHGLDVRRFPIPDVSVPRDMRATTQLVQELVQRYELGERILIHCNGGLGRSGILAACLRVALGLDPTAPEAIAAVRRLRSSRAIETHEQEKFVERFHKSWSRRAAPRGGAEAPVIITAAAATPEHIASRRRGAWFGLAVGDALGAPIEFMTAAEIGSQYGTWTEMAEGGRWDKGEWTDDTALAIATAQAYGGPEFDLGRTAAAMVEWLSGDPKDVGGHTRTALRLLRDGLAPLEAGEEAQRRNPKSAANGSLMRAAPTGLVRKPADPRLAAEAAQLSQITHAERRCKDSCVAFNAALSSLIHCGPDIPAALSTALAAMPRDSEVRELILGVSEGRVPQYSEKPIGFVLLCLERALIALRDAASFEEGLIWVLNLGGDTDTNAAVAGALLGARFGFDAIPTRWLEPLLGQDALEDALACLTDFAAREPEVVPAPLPATLALASDGSSALSCALIGVHHLSDSKYRCLWKFTSADETAQVVSSIIDGERGKASPEEPLKSWCHDLLNRKTPEGLAADERRRWQICQLVHRASQRAIESGLFTPLT